jgi:Ca2+-binding RTX toxin-like protein
MIVIGAGVASLALPGVSFAGVASSDGSDVSYVAAAGEQNDITVDLASGTYTITDTAGVTATGPCVSAGANSATCPEPTPTAGAVPPDVDHLSVSAGDGDDTITVNATPALGTRIDGGAGNDTIVGSAGPDKILGGPGDDVVDPNDVSTVNMNDPFVDFEACFNDPDFTDFTLFGCPDLVDGEQGFNTLRFDHKPDGLIIDTGGRLRSEGISVVDPTRDRNGDTRSNLLVLGVRVNMRFAKIVGTPGNDQIYGSSNNDTLVGRGGADVLCGGPGNDTVDYSESNGPVDVSLDTDLSPDPWWASDVAAEWSNARGDCRQTSQREDPEVPGTILPDRPKDCVANDGGADDEATVVGKVIKDCVGVDVENVIGSDHSDTLVGDSPGPYIKNAAFFEPRGVNVLDGRGGNDFLDGRFGSDVLIGGTGTDTVSYAFEQAPVGSPPVIVPQDVHATIDGAANDGSAMDVNPDTGLGDSIDPSVENLIGGPGDDVLAGSSADNNITGGAGNDVLAGEDGSDTLDGQDGLDVVRGQAGDDTVQGGADDDVLDGGFGGDTISGGDGEDVADYSNSTTPVYAAPDGVANDGSATDVSAATGARDNIDATVEDLIGGSDNDTLVAGGGASVLAGGPGNDQLVSGPGSDLIIGGADFDTVSYAGRTAPVTVDLAAGAGGGEGDEISEVENATGGESDDTLLGTDDVNVLSGGAGNDTIDGRGGPDQLFGGDGNDTEVGGTGADTIAGDGGNDTLQGGDDNDGLSGGAGDDSLDGQGGADILTGGPGNDTAMYASRTGDVTVTMDGADNDGESGEHDQVRLTTESAKTGSGDDTINVKDGVNGNVACGGGNDSVISDTDDTVANDCEQRSTLGALSTCSVRTGLAKMGRKGVVRLRISCPTSGKAKLRLRTVGRAKRAKSLGASKTVRLRAGRVKTVKVKLKKRAKRLLKRHKGSLRAHGTISLKRATASKAIRRSQNLTILAAKWRR